MILEPFQRKFLLDIFDNPHTTRTAILSIPRGQSKSTLIACIILLYLVGPESVRNAEIYSAAMTREQASIVHGLAAQILELSRTLRPFLTVTHYRKEIACPRRGTIYRALSSDKTGGKSMGMAPLLSVFDESGQIVSDNDPLIDALETAMTKHANPLSIFISTQAPDDGAFLSQKIDSAHHDPHTVCHVHTAPEMDANGKEIDTFSMKALRLANPATFTNWKFLKQQAAKAKRLPSFRASYENLHLNRRIDRHAPFVDRSLWEANQKGHPHESDIAGRDVYLAIDLSETTDLSAMVALHRDSDDNTVLHVNPEFWLPDGIDLAQKSIDDRAPIKTWVDQGLITVTPGKTVDYNWIAHRISEIKKSANIVQIFYDRWRIKYLKRAMIDQGIPESWI